MSLYPEYFIISGQMGLQCSRVAVGGYNRGSIQSVQAIVQGQPLKVLGTVY